MKKRIKVGKGKANCEKTSCPQAEAAQRGADNANPTLLGLGQKSGELGRKHGGFSVLCSTRKKVLLLNLGHPFTCFRSGVVFYFKRHTNHRHQFPEVHEKKRHHNEKGHRLLIAPLPIQNESKHLGTDKKPFLALWNACFDPKFFLLKTPVLTDARHSPDK